MGQPGACHPLGRVTPLWLSPKPPETGHQLQ